MAMVKGAVRSRLMRTDPGAPSDLLDDLTRIVDGAGNPGMFVTMASLRFRRGSQRVEIALAGHNPVLWWRKTERRLDAIDNEGLPLGVSADERYATTVIEPAPGDWLLLYTDGLVEVNDTDGRQLGMRGFRAIVEEVVRGAGSADMVVSRVLERVRAHGPITDDQTIAVVRFAP
jgi:sigma-B regulation protein RsbU (phosphoserine phosphatase)